uniref:Uncharacterized protein n=1 Tax=Anopheles farauti TaxID=69004 RepID=A0A182Q5I9_9DIPT
MENQPVVHKPGEKTPGDPNATLTAKLGKRSALEPMVKLGNASTPFTSTDGRKRLVLECDRTPFGPVSLNGSNHSLVLSTPNRTLSTTRSMSFTRGMQTIPVKTTNRYCQVSVVPKRTITLPVQTDESFLRPPTPPPTPKPIERTEMGCQTDEPAGRETCVGTTQTMRVEMPLMLLRPTVQSENVACQTEPVVPEATVARCEDVSKQHLQQQGVADDDVEEGIDSISWVLNDIAKQYGITLQPPTVEKKKKKSKQEQIDFLQECLVKKTYRAVASKVDEKLPKVLEQRLDAYGRETAACRQRLIRWAKHFIRQQQQKQLQAAKARPTVRKVIVLKRKVVRASQPAVPVEDKEVQCDPEQPAPAPTTSAVTVGTQWQRQKPPPRVKKQAGSSARKKAATTTPKTNTKSKTSSTDCKTCSAGAVAGRTRQPMRQTKMSLYAQGSADKGKRQQPQQRKQQGECSPKSSAKLPAAVTPKARRSSQKPEATKVPTPSNAKKTTRRQQKSQSESEGTFIEETPSPPSEPERKYLPYRSPPRFSSTQCSKSTDTSFLTSSQISNLLPPHQIVLDQLDLDQRMSYNSEHLQPVNPEQLVSPLGRMHVHPTTVVPNPRSHTPRYCNTFLVPITKPAQENIPATTPRNMVYVNPSERRVLRRSRAAPGTEGLVREKTPESL